MSVFEAIYSSGLQGSVLGSANASGAQGSLFAFASTRAGRSTRKRTANRAAGEGMVVVGGQGAYGHCLLDEDERETEGAAEVILLTFLLPPLGT